MGMYQLRHVNTGVTLPGYQVTEAQPIEIKHANRRLKAAGSSYRLVPCLTTKRESSPTLVTSNAQPN